MRHGNTAGGQIITLFQKQPTRQNQIISNLFDYWENLRAGRKAPIRSEIDPREIKDTLQHTFILERVSRGAPRFRLAGIEVCDLLGMELRGMPGYALFDETDRVEFNDQLQNVLENSQIIHMRLKGVLAAGHVVNAQMILLPLQDNNGEMTRVIGAVVLETELLRPPVRFTIERCEVTRIISNDLFPTPDIQNAAFHDAETPFQVQQKRPPSFRGRPNLKLIK